MRALAATTCGGLCKRGGGSMRIHKSVTLARVCQAIQEGDSPGFCLACGEEAHGIEPDAEKYECECCGADGVYGAEELLLYLS